MDTSFCQRSDISAFWIPVSWFRRRCFSCATPSARALIVVQLPVASAVQIRRSLAAILCNFSHIPDHERSDETPDALDPREHTTLMILIAAAAPAGKLDAAAIEREASELGVPLSRRAINKHLTCIDDAIERRKA